MTHRVRAGALVVVIATGLLAGCGSQSSSDSERLRAEEIERAKDEGRRQARAEERSKAAAAEAKRLQKEIDALKKGGSGSGGSSSTNPPPAPPPPPASSGSTGCGDGLSVNSVTTCPFARNVRDAYEQSGGARVVLVYSPVTKREYVMNCSDGVPTVCRGGNGAIVYIR